MKCVIATNRVWNEDLPKVLKKKTGINFILINQKNKITFEKLQKIKPRYVFFPHWSYIIPKEIYKNFECVIFHMTELPFGRGGSPLQNLIVREIYETKISALQCVEKIDAGPIYMRKKLSLHGNAEEIFLRASLLVENIILEIIKNNPIPKRQIGKPIIFKRRKKEDGNISKLNSLNQVFDYIRMVDADGYPKAFCEIGNFRFELSRASLKHGKIIADVEIMQKQDKT